MKRETTIAFLGALVGLSPFLGLPYSFLMVALPVLGLIIIALGLIGRLRSRTPSAREAAPYAEGA